MMFLCGSSSCPLIASQSSHCAIASTARTRAIVSFCMGHVMPLHARVAHRVARCCYPAVMATVRLRPSSTLQAVAASTHHHSSSSSSSRPRCQCGARLLLSSRGARGSRRSISHHHHDAGSSSGSASSVVAATGPEVLLFFSPSFGHSGNTAASTSASSIPASTPTASAVAPASVRPSRQHLGWIPKFRASAAPPSSSRSLGLSPVAASHAPTPASPYAASVSVPRGSRSALFASPSPQRYPSSSAPLPLHKRRLSTSATANQEQHFAEQMHAYDRGGEPPYPPSTSARLDTKGKGRAVQQDEHALDSGYTADKLYRQNGDAVADTARQQVRASPQRVRQPKQSTSHLLTKRKLKTLDSIRNEVFALSAKGTTLSPDLANEYSALRGRFYRFTRKFLTHTFDSDAADSDIARKQSAALLGDMVRLHLPFSDTEHMEALIEHYEANADALSFRYSRSSYGTLMRGYVQQMDVDGAFSVLHRMDKRAALLEEAQLAEGEQVDGRSRPGEAVFLHLVTLFARRRDPESARRVIDHMEAERGLTPSLAIYTSLMNAHVEAGQWDEAVALFEWLDAHPPEHPYTPDLHACTTLIKAYVLMGAPVSEVIRVYSGLVNRGIKPSSKTFALLLQATCDAGMLDFAEEIFRKMDALPAERPGSSNNGNFRVETQGGPRWKHDPRVAAPSRRKDGAGGDSGAARQSMANVYAFSIMIKGFLRAGQLDSARDYYEEMVRRGIRPSSATWSILIGAYADAQVTDPRAEAVVRGLLDEFLAVYIQPAATDAADGGELKRKRLGRGPYQEDKNAANGTALQSVYGPIITAYGQIAALSRPPTAASNLLAAGPGANAKALEAGKQEDESGSLARQEDSRHRLEEAVDVAQKATEKFREMLSLPGAKPSVHIYTALLDAYRRTNDMQGLQQIWDALHSLALSTTKQDHAQLLSETTKSERGGPGVARPIDPSRRNLLCLPLSIYIDALSANNLHAEIASVWMKLQSEGFGFDAANWNHLAVALVRAGELDRAFWTVETVLLQEATALALPSLEGRSNDIVDENLDTYDHQEFLQAADHVREVQAARAETPIRPPNRSHEAHVGEKEYLARRGDKLTLPGAEESSSRSRGPSLAAGGSDRRGTEDGEPDAIDQALVSHALDTEEAASRSPAREYSATSLTTSDPPMRRQQRSESVTAPGDLTRSFNWLRERSHRNTWTAHAATLRVLEDALARLRQVRDTVPLRLSSNDSDAFDQEARQAAARRQEAAAEQVDKITQSYPLTVRAIQEYREKANLRASRLASRL